jgi:hypothetical protein
MGKHSKKSESATPSQIKFLLRYMFSKRPIKYSCNPKDLLRNYSPQQDCHPGSPRDFKPGPTRDYRNEPVLARPDSEYFGSTDGANALCSWLAIFHRDFLRIFDIPFCLAFDAVSLYHVTSQALHAIKYNSITQSIIKEESFKG